MYEQFWEMVPPDVSYTNTQQTPNLKYRKCVNYLFPILSGWEIIHAWEVNILIMSLPSSTSTRSLTRFVCAFRRAIACSISRNSTNAEKWFEDCVIIHWYVKYNFVDTKYLFIIKCLTCWKGIVSFYMLHSWIAQWKIMKTLK